jgi:hypothetical protein
VSFPSKPCAYDADTPSGRARERHFPPAPPSHASKATGSRPSLRYAVC